MELLFNENITLDLISIEWKEINPKIIECLERLIEDRNLSGKTYVGISQSWGELPIQYRADEVNNGIIYSVNNLSKMKPFLENYRAVYSFDTNIKYDNAITVTIEQSDDYNITTILFNAKDDYFMIRIGYPKAKEKLVDYNQMVKYLKK